MLHGAPGSMHSVSKKQLTPPTAIPISPRKSSMPGGSPKVGGSLYRLRENTWSPKYVQHPSPWVDIHCSHSRPRSPPPQLLPSVAAVKRAKIEQAVAAEGKDLADAAPKDAAHQAVHPVGEGGLGWGGLKGQQGGQNLLSFIRSKTSPSSPAQPSHTAPHQHSALMSDL